MCPNIHTRCFQACSTSNKRRKHTFFTWCTNTKPNFRKQTNKIQSGLFILNIIPLIRALNLSGRKHCGSSSSSKKTSYFFFLLLKASQCNVLNQQLRDPPRHLWLLSHIPSKFTSLTAISDVARSPCLLITHTQFDALSFCVHKTQPIPEAHQQ